MNFFRRAIERAKAASNTEDPRGLAPVKRKETGLASVARAALNARGPAVRRQGIRLAKRMGR